MNRILQGFILFLVTLSSTAQVTPFFTLKKCDSSGSGLAIFNFWEVGSAKTIILDAQTSDDIEIFFYNTLAEAQAFTTIGLTYDQQFAYTNTTNPQTLYYVVLDVNNSNATAIGSFNLSVVNQLEPIPDVSACEMYLLPPLPVGKYFTGPGGSGDMIPAGIAITEDTTIYVYEANCGNSIMFEINISNELIFPDIYACEFYTLPYLEEVIYYENGEMLAQIPPGTVITENQGIYAHRVNGPLNCGSGTYFNIYFDYSVFVQEYGIYSLECAQNGIGQFDLNTAVTSQFPGLQMTYHATTNDAQTGNALLPLMYTNTTPFDQTIFVRFYNGQCAKIYPVELHVLHVDFNQPAPVGVCDQDGDGTYFAEYADFDNTASQITFNHPQTAFEGFYQSAEFAVTGEQPLGETFSGTLPFIYARVSALGCVVIIPVPLNIISGCTMDVDIKSANTFKMYPNPASQLIMVDGDSIFGHRVIISDLLGKTVAATKVTETREIDITSLAPGLYFVTLSNGHAASTQKLIVK